MFLDRIFFLVRNEVILIRCVHTMSGVGCNGRVCGYLLCTCS